MLEILQYPFMQRALIGGIALAAIFALLGVYVLLRRMAFFAEGIAHASLGSVAVGIVFAINPLATALVFSIVFALIIYFVEKRYRLGSDTAIGILFTSGLAFGVLLISFKSGYQPELLSFLFGNILAINQTELLLMVIIGIAVIAFIIKYFKSLTLLSFDEETAYATGVNISFLLPALYCILAVSVVLGIKILGVVLVSALLILPASTSRLISRSFTRLVAGSVVIAEATVITGIFLSYYFNLPTGPAIVLTGALFFAVIALYSGFAHKLVKQ